MIATCGDQTHQPDVTSPEEPAARREISDGDSCKDSPDGLTKTPAARGEAIRPPRASRSRLGLDESDWVWLEGGEFLMGSPENEHGRYADERQHRVKVNAFGIMKTPVTWGMVKYYRAATRRSLPYHPDFPYDDDHPVVNVTWDFAWAYAEWLSRDSGWRCRLPTEAEWEFACRAGTETAYWWGNDIGSNRANCDGCASQWDGKGTSPVKSFAPNPWGLYDMHGNVWEWTGSAYMRTYDGSEREISRDSLCIALRGGPWYYFPRDARAANRFKHKVNRPFCDEGLRLVQD